MSDVASQLFEREAIRELIARVGRLLDTKDFAAVIASFAEPGSYVLRAYSPEIGKEMIWMSVKRAELLRLLRSRRNMCMTWPTGRIRSLWIKSASKKARHWRGRPFQCSVLT